MNANPTLALGLAITYMEESSGLGEADRAYAELRVYPAVGAGYYFVRGRSPGRWYWMDKAGADHFNRADQTEVDAAIRDGVRVQLLGQRGQGLALWRTWGEFEKCVR